MRVKIFTMTHKCFKKPEMDIYVPLHVGRALSEDLGYPGDDTGENISASNPYYGELTGLYWIWKNETEADIVGICHYRRYFLNDTGSFMSGEEYEKALSGCDVMVSQLLSNGHSNWDNYAKMHNAADMEAVGKAVKKLYPQDYQAFCDVLNSTRCCFGNLMVTAAGKFREYCSWLFSILEEASKSIDVSGYDNYHKRVYGFLSEVLLYVWVTAKKYRICECRIGVTAEKSETAECRQTVGHLLAEGKITQARAYFYDYLKQRPDIRLETSDIHGEIPKIEKILYIIHEERKLKESGLLDLSRNLKVLLEHYGHVYQLIKKYGNQAKDAGKTYFSAFAVSDTAYRIIEDDVNGRLSLYEYLNEENLTKKISIIVPVSGMTDTLTGCIGNLVHQTMEDIEIIFVMEQPADDIRQLMQECQRQFPEKVRVMERGRNLQNLSLKSEYVLFVRAQDLPDTAICEKLYAKAKKTGWMLTGGRYIDRRNGCAERMLTEEMSGRLDEDSKCRFLETKDMFWGLLMHRDVWNWKIAQPEMQNEKGDERKETAVFEWLSRKIFSSGDMKELMKELLQVIDSAGSIEAVVYGYSG